MKAIKARMYSESRSGLPFPLRRTGLRAAAPILEPSTRERTDEGKCAHVYAVFIRGVRQCRGAAYNRFMGSTEWTIRGLRTALAEESVRPADLARQALERSNQNAGQNTYLWSDPAWTLAEAARAERMPRSHGGRFGDGRNPLWGLPVSLKDCFDLAGSPTSCGVQFYRRRGPAAEDSWLAARLRAAGAVIIGKTHLHPLAYGITGENPEFGDCVQPHHPDTLTGGSSSGAAASILENSAVAAIGTDTGGSIRAPASLCGLAGYRASLGRGSWHGAGHLAESFDTMGWLFRDLEDASLLGDMFANGRSGTDQAFERYAVVSEQFLNDCEPGVAESLRQTALELEALGLEGKTLDIPWWADSFEIYAPIQAWEAARVHAGHFGHFPGPIAERLEWGARITASEIAQFRIRHAQFVKRLDELFAVHELLLMPAAPVTRLVAGADHGEARTRILRYTTPFSLAGVPVVTIPALRGGIQLAAAREKDESLLALASGLGAQRNQHGAHSQT